MYIYTHMPGSIQHNFMLCFSCWVDVISIESKGVPRISGSSVRSLGSCQKKKHWRQAVPRSARRAQNFKVVGALIRKWSKKETLAAGSPQKRRIPSNLEVVSAVTRARVKGRRPVAWIT